MLHRKVNYPQLPKVLCCKLRISAEGSREFHIAGCRLSEIALWFRQTPYVATSQMGHATETTQAPFQTDTSTYLQCELGVSQPECVCVCV